MIGYTSNGDFDRVVRTVQGFEGPPPVVADGRAGGAQSVASPQHVRATGAGDGDGCHPAKVVYWNDVAKEWADQGDEVRLRAANGGPLATTRVYLARCVGSHAGYPLFQAGEGGGFDLVRCDSYPTDGGTPDLPVPDSDGMGTVLVPNGSGGYADGSAVVLRLLPDSGQEFAVGHVYVAQRNGTETVGEGEEAETLPLYFAAGNHVEIIQRRKTVGGECTVVCQRWSLPAPVSIVDLPECPE